MDQLGLAGRIADRLLDSPLVPLFVVACFILGGYSLLVTPREDRPDINVPTAVVLIPWPGGGAERVDDQLARRAGGWIRQLSSVTEIRSSSTDHAALLTVEFEPGTAKTAAFAALDELLRAHKRHLPVAAGPPRIETFGEERLVMFMATLSSKSHAPRELEQIAGELAAWLESVAGVRGITRHGGDQQAIEILPRPGDMAAYGISFDQTAKAIAAAGRRIPVGCLEGAPVAAVQAGTDIESCEKLARVPVGQGASGPVYLEDVADIRNGTVGRNQAVLYWRHGQSTAYPAVTLAVTTLAGENVAEVTRRVTQRMSGLKTALVPPGMQLSICYDAGREATQRVYNVLSQLLTGTLIVVGIIWFGLGWRAAFIIALMMPASLAIVPFIYNQFDFTLNPVSIAAMILAIGILSDDAVVMLENVSRHFRKAGKKNRELTVKAVNEVGNPTILGDLLVVATLLPTAFITGEMGQYIRALPVGASAAVIFSLLVALSITPYFGLRLLKVGHSARPGNDAGNGERQTAPPDKGYGRFYRALMYPLMTHGFLRWFLYLALLLLLLASFSMVGLRWVQVGLTPLLDRQIFAVDVELPAGATLTETLAAASAVSRNLRKLPEVNALTIYAGTKAPFIYPPPGIQVPADVPPHRARLHVEMVPNQERRRLSYEVSREVAHHLGDWLAPFNARGYIGRIPSGPSSDRAVTAEIYGPDTKSRQSLSDHVERWFGHQPGVVATEQFPKTPLPVLNLKVDPRRAAMHGVIPAEATRTLFLGVKGRPVTDWPDARFRESVPVILRLDETRRDTAESLKSIYIPGIEDQPVPLKELVNFNQQPGHPIRYRRDLLPLVTVVADLDRSVAQPLTVQLAGGRGFHTRTDSRPVPARWLSPPGQTADPQLYWSGEWEMTRDVYRNLGTAGAVVMLLIYLLLAAWFSSYTLPFLIMLPIPLIFIGVIPAHWVWGINLVGTGVLGIIALAGIVARNSILLMDFIKQRENEGMALKEAVLQAGIQRTRPILLTAATVMFGSGVLVFEPSLKPLGLTLASGVLISTLLTLVLIPVLYFHVHRNAGGADEQPPDEA